MRNRIVCFVACLSLAGLVFAGDVAEFRDLGFSADGKTYFFAQYGITDVSFCGYAEIYSVDVAANAFVSNGVFKIAPTAATAGKNGMTVYNQLADKNAGFIKRYAPVPVSIDNTLYLRSYEDKQPGEEIRFKDFENSTVDNPVYYHMNLVSSSEGTGTQVQSSFFIAVEKRDASGALISRKVAGNPGYKRAGVSGYRIEKVFYEPANRNLVIVVEKQIAEKKGSSIRYMIETCSAD